MRLIIALGVMLSFFLSQAATAGRLTYPALIGEWTVQGVKVLDQGNGQALVDNDPQYMKAVVAFEPDKIIWLKGTKARPVDPEIDNCDTAPSLVPTNNADPGSGDKVKGGFTILCGKDGWGPGSGAVVVPVSAEMITLYWYDNGVLSLRRVK